LKKRRNGSLTREREKRRNYLYKEGQGGQAGGEREEKVECYGCVTQVAVLAATECHTLSSRERERKRGVKPWLSIYVSKRDLKAQPNKPAESCSFSSLP
jgi:hypothetical protein